MTTSAGIDQTTKSILPSYASSSLRVARALDERYHQANPKVARITGTITTNMMAVELISRRRSADATGPCGSSTPVCAQDATGTPALTTSQRGHPEPLTEGLQYKRRYQQSLVPRLLNHQFAFSVGVF